MERYAYISECGKYRYLLKRVWEADRPQALFVMLNPSTADAEVDDATIRSCIRLCKSWGFGAFEVVNLFSWRATDPNELLNVDDPVGLANDIFVAKAVERCDLPICAWGAHGTAIPRANEVTNIITSRRPSAFCLGTTKAGAPKHPLYIKTGTPLVTYHS